jgi:predicted nucleic acid-binding Zn ribbon protein
MGANPTRRRATMYIGIGTIILIIILVVILT